MTKCQGLMGLIFGHNFVGNYDEKERFHPFTLNNGSVFMDASDVVRITEAHKVIDQTYINSVCTRCGEIIPKDPTALIK